MGSQQFQRSTQWGVLHTHPILDGSTYVITVANLFFHGNRVFFGSTLCLPVSYSYVTTAFSGFRDAFLWMKIHILHSGKDILTLSSQVWFLIALI